MKTNTQPCRQRNRICPPTDHMRNNPTLTAEVAGTGRMAIESIQLGASAVTATFRPDFSASNITIAILVLLCVVIATADVTITAALAPAAFAACAVTSVAARCASTSTTSTRTIQPAPLGFFASIPVFHSGCPL